MPLPIENYALIGDCHTAALVGSDGSIDWLCFPRFDSAACFAALLGGPEHGRWQIAPTAEIKSVRRRYRGETLILETDFETAQGSARLIDFMPLSDERWDVVRIVEGLSGKVTLRMELIVRFDYGSIVPWVRRCGQRAVDHCRTRHARTHRLDSRQRREHEDGRRVHGWRGRSPVIRAQLPPLSSGHVASQSMELKRSNRPSQPGAAGPIAAIFRVAGIRPSFAHSLP